MWPVSHNSLKQDAYIQRGCWEHSLGQTTPRHFLKKNYLVRAKTSSGIGQQGCASARAHLLFQFTFLPQTWTQFCKYLIALAVCHIHFTARQFTQVLCTKHYNRHYLYMLIYNYTHFFL